MIGKVNNVIASNAVLLLLFESFLFLKAKSPPVPPSAPVTKPVSKSLSLSLPYGVNESSSPTSNAKEEPLLSATTTATTEEDASGSDANVVNASPSKNIAADSPVVSTTSYSEKEARTDDTIKSITKMKVPEAKSGKHSSDSFSILLFTISNITTDFSLMYQY
jgi:hypothetical protein